MKLQGTAYSSQGLSVSDFDYKTCLSPIVTEHHLSTADLKEEWLGKNFRKGLTHCDEDKTHVPLIRAKFRAEHLALEHLMVTLLAAGKGKMVLEQMMNQFGEARNGIRDILFSNMAEVPNFPEQNQL